MRPRVIINCAASIDGKTALPDGTPLSISTTEDLARVHRLRNDSDAIMVGINTIMFDDPSLKVKKEYVIDAKAIMRIIVDSSGRTPDSARVLDGSLPTMIATAKGGSERFRDIKASGFEAVEFGEGKVDLEALLHHLYERGIGQVMVEGGGTLVWSLLGAGLVDELLVFQAPIVIGGNGPTVAAGDGAVSSDLVIGMVLKEAERMDGGILLKYIPRRD